MKMGKTRLPIRQLTAEEEKHLEIGLNQLGKI